MTSPPPGQHGFHTPPEHRAGLAVPAARVSLHGDQRGFWLASIFLAVFGGGGLAIYTVIGFGFTSAVVAAVLTLIPTAVVASFIAWLDRHEPEPPSWLALTFIWGATVSVGIALVGTIPTQMACEALGFPRAFAELLSAPIIEEIAKGTILLLLAVRFRREFNGRVDGMVYSGTAALGFAAVENVFYIASSLNEYGVSEAAVTFFVRGIMSPFAHPIFTAMIGLGLGTAVTSSKKSSWFIWPPLGLLAAIILHLLWNASALSNEFFILYFLVQMPIFVLMWVLVRWQRKHELALISRYAGEFREAGWLTEQHLSWVGSGLQRREARQWASAVYGSQGKAQMHRFQHIVADLAYLRDRLVRGTAVRGAEQQQLHLLFELSAARTALDGGLSWASSGTGLAPAGAMAGGQFGSNYDPSAPVQYPAAGHGQPFQSGLAGVAPSTSPSHAGYPTSVQPTAAAAPHGQPGWPHHNANQAGVQAPGQAATGEPSFLAAPGQSLPADHGTHPHQPGFSAQPGYSTPSSVSGQSPQPAQQPYSPQPQPPSYPSPHNPAQPNPSAPGTTAYGQDQTATSQPAWLKDPNDARPGDQR